MFSMTEVTVVPCEISISAGTQTGQCRPTYQQNISTANYQSLYEDSVPDSSPTRLRKKYPPLLVLDPSG